MVCPNCGTKKAPEAEFCGGCGYAFPRPTPAEGRPLHIPAGINLEELFSFTGNREKTLPLTGALFGLGGGGLALLGWFGRFTALNFGNGPQLITLPFKLLGSEEQLQQLLPSLRGLFSSIYEITGWVVILSALLAAASLAMAAMSLLSMWVGVKCLEFRSDPADLPVVKAQINRLGRYSLAGIGLVIGMMIFASTLSIGNKPIGGGLVTMAVGFAAAYLGVVYLKPHLRK